MTENKRLSVSELAEMVEGIVVGDDSAIINDFAPIEKAGKGDVTFLVKAGFAERLVDSPASAVLVPMAVEAVPGKTIVRVRDPYLASAILQNFFLQEEFSAAGIHPSAVVGAGCEIDSQVSIGPLVCIGSGVRIGPGVTLEPGCVLGDNVEVGDGTTLKANVTVYKECIIGKKVIIHSGTVIGSDGYGYATNERGEHVKRPQVGIVRIGDEVEIGANSCVDRAAFGETIIKAGSKIDNLVQIAHNVEVGENSLIVSQVGISGSTRLGRNVVMGGQSATTGHITIGDQTMIAARGAAHTDLPSKSKVGGAPAIPVRQWAKCSAIFNRLPELQKTVREHTRSLKDLSGSGKEDVEKENE